MRVAIVGFGNMGEKHAQKLAKMPGVEPAIVFRKRASPVENRAKYAQTDVAANMIFGRQVPLFDNIDACISRFRPEAAIIASPTEAHFEQAREFLRARKALLVEKPLTLSISQDAALVQLARRGKTPLIVGWTERYNPAVRILLDGNMVKGLGKIKTIESMRSYKSHKPEHPLVNNGTHDMDAALRVLQNEDTIRLVSSQEETLGGKVVKATAFVDFASGAKVKAGVVFSAETKREMVITGSEGEATINFAEKTLVMTGRRGGTFRSDADQLQEELSFFLRLAGGEKIEADSWLLDTGTAAVDIMMSATATRISFSDALTAR